MSLKTITFAADKWQLVPKVATEEMMKAGRDGLLYCTEKYEFDFDYAAALDAAPQPEPLSPWMPIDDFLKTPVFFCPCFIFHKGEVREGYIHKFIIKDIATPRFYPDKFSNNCFLTECISHVCLITQPQAPEVE